MNKLLAFIRKMLFPVQPGKVRLYKGRLRFDDGSSMHVSELGEPCFEGDDEGFKAWLASQKDTP